MRKPKTTKLTRALKTVVKGIERELERLNSPLLESRTELAVEHLEAARRDLVALVDLHTPR